MNRSECCMTSMLGIPTLVSRCIVRQSYREFCFRKKAVSSLGLTTESTVLDVAYGTVFNFKIIECYLKNSGKLVAIDISSESLKAAKRRIIKHE